MSGWPIIRLGELLEVLNGFAFDSKRFDASKGMPLIRIRDLKDGQSTTVRFDGEYDDRFVVSRGDYLIGMDGEFACHEWLGEDALLNQRVCKLTNFARQLDARFLYYGINKYLKEIEDATTFTTVKHLSSKTIKSIKFPLPPLAEQRRIVAILDGAFAGIATAVANGEKSLENARELLGSEVAWMLAGGESAFDRVKVGAVATVISGQHISKGDYNLDRNGIGYLTGPSDFGPEHPAVTKWTENPKKTALRDDILITVKGSGVGSLNVMVEDELAIGRQLMAIRCDEPIRSLIYFQLLGRQSHFQALANGAAIPGLSRNDILSFEIAVPKHGTGAEFAERLSMLKEQTDLLVANYVNRLYELDQLREAVLAKAFSGELISADQAVAA